MFAKSGLMKLKEEKLFFFLFSWCDVGTRCLPLLVSSSILYPRNLMSLTWNDGIHHGSGLITPLESVQIQCFQALIWAAHCPT